MDCECAAHPAQFFCIFHYVSAHRLGAFCGARLYVCEGLMGVVASACSGLYWLK
jgi:hypothetical protein